MEFQPEAERLDALRAYDILDSLPEPGFDRFAALAARIFEMPMAVVAFADRHRHWFKARAGVEGGEMPRNLSFCDATLAARAPFVVPDTLQDARFAAAPVVAGPPHVRFYAGAPLISPEGHALGSLCVLDTVARRDFDARQCAILADMAAHVMELVEARSRQAALHQRSRELRRNAVLLKRISDAPTWEQAIEDVLAEICAYHDAVVGGLWRLAPDGQGVRFVHGHARNPAEHAWYMELCRSFPATADNSLIGRSMRDLQPMHFRIDQICDPTLASLSVHHRLQASGFRAQVFQPVHTDSGTFAFMLILDRVPAELEAVSRDLQDLTETLRPALFRKIAADRMRLLGTALDASDDGVLILECTNDDPFVSPIIYANAGFTRATGYSHAELIGRQIGMLYDVETRRQAECLGIPLLRDQRPVSMEMTSLRKDGSTYQVELSVTPVLDEAGQCTHLISTRRDITERKQAEAARHEREASFRLLFENNPVPMWVYDPRTLRFLEVNRVAAEKYGWSREDFLAKTLYDICPPEQHGRFIAAFTDASTSFSPVGPLAHVLADGRRIQVMVARHALVFEGAEAGLAAVWDVTEVEQARMALRANQERLERLTRELRQRTEELGQASAIARLGSWHWRIATAEMSWSDEVYRMAGRRWDGQPLGYEAALACVHPEDRAGFAATLAEVARGGDAAEYALRMLSPGGVVRHCWGTASPVRDAAGAIVALAGVQQDITERKEAELALLHSEKLRTIGQLTGGVAHDFNNLLMVVGLSLEDALETPRLDPALRAALEPALNATLRGRELTSQLLSYARRQPLQPEALALEPLLGELAPLLRRAIGARHTLAVVAPPGLQACRVDRAQLEHAVMNLVINAGHAMPEGGEIVLRAANVAVGAAETAELAAGNYVALAICDTGTGMSAEVLARVFEPFFTTKSSGHGSGLGLSMVYGFAKQSGGHVAIDSAPGRGTCVTLTLPAAAEAAPAPSGRDGAAGWDAVARCVLLVEGQEPVRAAVSRQLAGLNFTVTAVRDADEALAALNRGEPFDLLFADAMLPGDMDGPELAALALARCPSIRVLLTSACARTMTEDTRDRAATLTKPYRRADLVARLRRLFGLAG